MKLNINGDPGTGNHYNDIHMDSVGSVNPHASTVNVYNQYQAPESRLASWFRQLREEFDNDIRLQEKMDDIMRYRTKLPHTLGLKRKLQDGGFTNMAINKACRLKQGYAKKATRYQYYKMATCIDNHLFAIVSSRFENYVYHLIEERKPLHEINNAVYEQVILPVMKELNENGADDTCLCYSIDDIFGMLYYLTGNCHINWAIYDV